MKTRQATNTSEDPTFGGQGASLLLNPTLPPFCPLVHYLRTAIKVIELGHLLPSSSHQEPLGGQSAWSRAATKRDSRDAVREGVEIVRKGLGYLIAPSQLRYTEG